MVCKYWLVKGGTENKMHSIYNVKIDRHLFYEDGAYSLRMDEFV